MCFYKEEGDGWQWIRLGECGVAPISMPAVNLPECPIVPVFLPSATSKFCSFNNIGGSICHGEGVVEEVGYVTVPFDCRKNRPKIGHDSTSIFLGEGNSTLFDVTRIRELENGQFFFLNEH